MTRVFAAVLNLAEQGGPGAVTMEGIATKAGVGKQTLYRTWPSVHAIVFDALVAESQAAAESEIVVGTFEALQATIAEINSEPRASLLRMLAAAIQSDEAVAHQFHARLFQPQQKVIRQVIAADGFVRPEQSAELLLAPLLFRWFLRLPPLTDGELCDHIDNVRRLDVSPSINVSGWYI